MHGKSYSKEGSFPAFLLREGSGNVKGKFREGSGKSPGMFRKDSGKIQGRFG